MIAEDLQSKERAAEAVSAKTAIRRYDPISEQHTSQWSKDAKNEQIQKYEDLARETDDPLLMKLLTEYVGKLLLDFDDVVEPNRTYIVLDVTYDDKGGGAYWEATCVEVRRQPDGSWITPPEHYLVVGEERIVHPRLLWGVILECLKDPDSPVHKPYADDYILAHQQRESAANTPTSAAPGEAITTSSGGKRRKNKRPRSST